MQAQPATKANQLVEDINSLNPTEHGYEMAVARIERTAKQLVSSEAYFGYSILAMVYCIQNKYDECVNHHKKALKLEPNNPWGISVYGMSMKRLGHPNSAVELLSQAYELDKGNLTYLRDIIDIQLSTGYLSKTMDWLNEWDKISPTESHPHAHIFHSIYAYIEQQEINEDHLVEYFDIARKVILKNKYLPQQDSFQCSDDYSDISYRIHVNADIETIIDMNIELSEELVERELVPGITSKLTVDIFQYPADEHV